MFIGTGIGMIASVVVAIIIPILGVLAMIICLIVLLVAFVWNLVLLYKSAVAVRDYVPE